MSHFSSIGFGAANEADFALTVDRAVERATPQPWSKLHSLFRDESGGALAVHANEVGAIECVTPYFVAPEPTTWRVRTAVPTLDEKCGHCSGADCDILDRAGGELVTRATVQWLFFEAYRRWLGEKREYDLEVVGFAHELSLCASLEELEQAQAQAFGAGPLEGAEKPMRLAENAFIPSGMFGPAGDLGQRAIGLLTGTVESLTRRQSTLGGAEFLQVRVRTLPGALDIVAPGDWLEPDREQPRFVLASVWLVGRPTEPPPEPSSWWKRIVH